MAVMHHDFPICTITSGDWGDDYPSLRLVGDSGLDLKAEAYMAQITYGSIAPEQAKVHAYLVAAAPDLLAACKALLWAYGNEAEEIAAMRLAEAAIAKAQAPAQAIEARSAATAKTGAVEDESAVPQGCAHPGAGQ